MPDHAARTLVPEPVRTPRPGPRRLVLGPVHAAPEREAGAVAAAVVSSRPAAGRTAPLRPATHGSVEPLDRSVESRAAAVLASPGRPLPDATRLDMEARFGHRFGDVRIHADGGAAASAREVGARSYTAGRRIVFGGGEYAPDRPSGRWLLAHELAHAIQAPSVADVDVIRRQPQGTTAAPDAGVDRTPVPAPGTTTQPAGPGPTPTGQPGPAAPRLDYVFIMGADPAGQPGFYDAAEHFYRTRIPGATFVTNLRNLADLLTYVSTQISQPIGSLYIVSHANEDGTLSFGLNGADPDSRTSVQELRGAIHPAAGGASTLASITTQVDAQTRIRVKGCDIGRTQAMVELLDEAFGGQGTVTAPTHEQQFGSDAAVEIAARRQFRAGIAASHAQPPPVDPALRGAARTAAIRARQQAVRARQAAINAEITARAGEETRVADQAAVFEAFSGPMFQRTGTTLFTAAEITPEVARLYGHLSLPQQASLVRRLVAGDRRPAATADRQGVYQQQGQRAFRKELLTQTFPEPRTLAEANALFASDFAANRFAPTRLLPTVRAAVTGGTEITTVVEGTFTARDGSTSTGTRRYPNSSPVPPDATLIAQARGQLPNPDRYAWRVATTHATTGITTLTVIAERVVAYLHHGSLDPAAGQHFTRPESDPNFFATSTFAPPPPAGAPTTTPTPAGTGGGRP